MQSPKVLTLLFVQALCSSSTLKCGGTPGKMIHPYRAIFTGSRHTLPFFNVSEK
ncbi:MAG: hypothetical protein H7832_05495 [Magnetococcus sp. DMHC-6]